MSPAGRLQAAIELLAAIEADPRPADAVATTFSVPAASLVPADRRAVSDRVWRVLRSYRRLIWWLAGTPTRSRLLVGASLLLEGAR